MNFQLKQKYSIHDLLAIMALLRSEHGCPWDKQQTHRSIRENFLEETCEALEAIDDENTPLLLEELGDVLLQVVFHAQIEQELGAFDFDDVANGVCQKLIVRHPHIFGDVQADNADQVLQNWDEIKAAQKQEKTAAESLKSVPKTLPALMKAAKVQKRAAKSGFDWKNIAGTLDKLGEEVIELREAIFSDNVENIFEEFGDVLFSAVNVSRFLKIEPEHCLNAATAKFVGRFEQVEQLALARGINMRESTIEELDILWDEVKASNH